MSDDYSANVQTTGAVAVGGSATGTIETAHDQDWFAVELAAGRTYQFDLGGSPSGGGTLSDTFLRAIYDSEGRYQSDSYNDDFGGSRDSRVTFTASQSGTYYVRASGDRDETGSYTLRVSDVTPGSVENPPPVEPPAETVAPEEPEPARAAAEDLGDITELAAARFPLGTLDGGADAVAWYRFTLSEAREVGLGLRRQDADADLVLEGAEGNVLHSSERSGTTNEWLRETLLAGTYYVRVEAQEAGANAYVFRYGVGDADPAEVARLEAERLSAQEQEQDEPPADPVVPPPPEPDTVQAQDESASVSEGDTDLPTDITTTGRVVVGGSATGNIESVGDRDWFAVDLKAGRIYQFDLEGSSTDGGTLGDPYLPGIYDVNGDRIARTTNNNGGEGYNSRVYFTPDEGATYYVSVGGAYRNHVGTYTLTVSDVTGDSDDYAADPTTTGTVGVGGSATGNIHTPGDRDWFAVELEANKTYRIDLGGSPTGAGTLWNPYLRGIYDEDGDRIDGATDDDGGLGRKSGVYFTPDESATYYVSAGDALNRIGTYTLTVSDATDDYAADPTTTGRVVVGGSATGNIDPPGDRDWFAVELEADKMYRIDLEGSLTGAGTLWNPVLRGIYDEDGDRIDGATDDDGRVGRNSRVYFTPDEDATYYVSASAGRYDIGTYTLTVSDATDDYAADPTTTGRVVVGGSATGDIDPPGDRDWFAVDLEADKMYRIDLEGSPTGGGTVRDPYLRGIYDEDGELIDSTTDDDGGEGYNSRVYFTPDEDAAYYVSAGAFVPTVVDYVEVGTYTLTVEEVDAM